MHGSARVTTRDVVTVERRRVIDRMPAAKIGADAVRVPLTEEEVVVEKRAVVKEEVVLRKHVVQDTHVIEADVRKERVDIADGSRTRGSMDSDLREGRSR